MPENTSPAEKRSRALTLFLTFFKIGAFTFGGGYAMLPTDPARNRRKAQMDH